MYAEYRVALEREHEASEVLRALLEEARRHVGSTTALACAAPRSRTALLIGR